VPAAVLEAARAGQQLVIGPYIHIPWERKVGDMDFGPEADNRADERQLRWFDYWLKGAPRPSWMNGVDYLHRGLRNVRPLYGESE